MRHGKKTRGDCEPVAPGVNGFGIKAELMFTLHSKISSARQSLAEGSEVPQRNPYIARKVFAALAEREKEVDVSRIEALKVQERLREAQSGSLWGNLMNIRAIRQAKRDYEEAYRHYQDDKALLMEDRDQAMESAQRDHDAIITKAHQFLIGHGRGLNTTIKRLERIEAMVPELTNEECRWPLRLLKSGIHPGKIESDVKKILASYSREVINPDTNPEEQRRMRMS